MKKRIATAILTLAMLCTMLPTALAAGTAIALDKEVYLPGETMTIQLSGTLPEEGHVMIYKENARIGQFYTYEGISYLDTTNTWTVDAPSDVGNYQVRVYGTFPHDDTIAASALMATKNFTVSYTGGSTAPTTPTTPSVSSGAIGLDKDAYTINEPMVVTLNGTFPEVGHVMIYKQNAKIDQFYAYEGISYLDATNTWRREAPDDIGSYQVRIYGTYPHDDAIAASALMATKDFTVAYNTTGKPGITLSKPSFAAEESMSITATGLSPVQIESGAVLMIYPQSGKLDQFAAYENVRDMDATNTWKVGAPRDAGIYEVRLYAQYPTYLTDLATGLLAQTTFTVGGAALPNQPVSGSVTPGQNGVSDWAIPEINNAIQEGLVTDKVTVDFSRPITREEFCELAVKLYEAISGNTAQAAPANTFTDTQNPEILKAYQLKIVNGTGQGLVSPGNPLSRQEIATMLLRTVKAAVPALDTSAPNAPAFVDSGDIADWAREGVNYFASKEIIKGANGAFMPKANTTCEAAIALVKRTFDSFTAI